VRTASQTLPGWGDEVPGWMPVGLKALACGGAAVRYAAVWQCGRGGVERAHGRVILMAG
jgi:hypothetical protein